MSAECRRMPKTAEMHRIREWLRVRTDSTEVRLVLASTRAIIVRSTDSSSAD
jgi:hypothetical protein